MNGQKQKFSELKKQAREAMAGRCGTLVGATAINLFLTFSCSLIRSEEHTSELQSHA